MFLAGRGRVRSTQPVRASGQSTRREITVRSLVAAVMLTQWVLLLAFSTSERLHQAVCDGSQQPSHDCALTSVAKGQLWSSLDFVGAPVPRPLEFFFEPVDCSEFHPLEDLRLMPDRGPPAPLLPT